MSSYSGLEHHVLGLSPQYWAYTPMLVVDLLHRLVVVNGVNCMLNFAQQKDAGGNSVFRKETIDCPKIHHAVPVSRCELLGILTNVDRRSNGSILYVLDDGTGLVDCVAWKEESLYSLPPLLASSNYNWSRRDLGRNETDHCGDDETLCVGDMVRILGKIKLIYVGIDSNGGASDKSLGDTCGKSNKKKRKICHVEGNGQQWEVIMDAVREVHITFIERQVEHSGTFGSLDCEAVHWLRCVQLERRMALGSFNILRDSGNADKKDDRSMHHQRNDFDDSNSILCARKNVPTEIEDEQYYKTCETNYEPVRNGANVLQLLGTEIETQVKTGDIVAADDEFGVWRLFGPDCLCHLSYKNELLYCHCQATVEPLDPHYVFRDALLNRLLEMERLVPLSSDDAESFLQFRYKMVFEMKPLTELATETVAKTSHPLINVRRLFINTFRALRDDGILHLVDQETDEYLLVSRSRVLQPYITQVVRKDESALSRNMRRSNPPAFLANVPPSRIRVLTKILSTKQRKESNSLDIGGHEFQ